MERIKKGKHFEFFFNKLSMKGATNSLKEIMIKNSTDYNE